MKTVELLKELGRHAVFNLATFQELTKSGPSYACVYIHRLRKAGYVFELQKGRYTVHKDPFIVASRVVWPSYVSLWSAIRYYNLTEQLPHDTWVVTTRRLWRGEMPFAGAKIRFVHVRPPYFFGYRKVSVSNFEVFMAEPEKAILDGALLRKISLSELAGIIRGNADMLDMRRLVSYMIETKNKPVIKRLGCLLDGLGMDYHARLKRSINKSFIPLEYSLPPKGRKNMKWIVIENMAIS